jgi:hypothetical protein
MTDTEDKFPSQEEWEAERRARASQQGLNPDDERSVPEQRPQETIAPPPVDGEVQKKLRDADSPMADNAPPHGYDEYKRAASESQARKAERNSLGPERLYPGAHAYINNPDGEGSEHHGRAVAINAVDEFATPGAEALANAGYNANRRFAEVATYECRSRDGRAELLIVSAEHLNPVSVNDFHKTVT